MRKRERPLPLASRRPGSGPEPEVIDSEDDEDMPRDEVAQRNKRRRLSRATERSNRDIVTVDDDDDFWRKELAEMKSRRHSTSAPRQASVRAPVRIRRGRGNF